MTWLLKIEFETKKAMEKFLEGLQPFGNVNKMWKLPDINPSLHGVIDVEYEELEEN